MNINDIYIYMILTIKKVLLYVGTGDLVVFFFQL